jgi:hypothetical protein
MGKMNQILNFILIYDLFVESGMAQGEMTSSFRDAQITSSETIA